VRDFRGAHPRVALHMHQGSPHQIAQMLIDGSADVGIATEALAQYDELLALPCYSWTHVVVVPPDHELARFAGKGGALTLQQLARHPIVTYESGYTGRAHIDQGFANGGLTPDVVLQAMDADVIKTYVELGLGVGIVAAIAFDDQRDTHLRAIDVRHLFAANMTRLAVRRGAYLRDFVYDFIAGFAPPLTKALVQRALHQPSGSDHGL
jgi:LysR family cys regulon transcriptional activator